MVGVILAIWIILTFWAEAKGPARSLDLGMTNTGKKVLVVYDPDPIYNLDEQVCQTFAEALAAEGMQVKIATVAAAAMPDLQGYDVFVCCANTYNWRPDWAIANFINTTPLENKPVVAITLGSGSTKASQKALERLITKKKSLLMDSRTYWLMRPNDESRMEESNVKVCLSLVTDWAREVATRL